jgi:cell filamentation protein
MTPADPEGLAFLPSRDPPIAQRYRLSLNKVEQELERYLPSARVEAAGRIDKFVTDGAPESQITHAMAELAYLDHSRGPAYQAQLLKQLGQRDVDAVITAQQTPLERVREIGAALGTRLKSQQPALVQRAIRALERGMSERSGPDTGTQIGKGVRSGAVSRPTRGLGTPPRDKWRSR